MKAKPYIFLLVLVAILIFILGTRYGQNVEKTNKTINYLISLPPTKPPPKIKPLDYLTYKSTTCGISFIYPNNLIYKERTNAVYFEDKETQKYKIKIDCPPLDIFIDYNTPVATAEITIKKKKIIASIYQDEGKKQEDYLFYLNDFVKNKQLICQVEKSLFPLFEKTLEFISP